MKTRTLSRKDRPDSGGLKENATRNTCHTLRICEAGRRQLAEAEKRAVFGFLHENTVARFDR